MILYFSATGNCKYVAARLADAAGEGTRSMVDCVKDGAFHFSDPCIGIVSPTYDFGIPSIVGDFLKEAERCLHRCPKFSIQYGNGKRTRAHGQYVNPSVTI